MSIRRIKVVCIIHYSMTRLSNKHEEIFTYEKPWVGVVGAIIYRVEETLRWWSLIKIKCLWTSNGDNEDLENLGIAWILAEYKEKWLLYILFSHFFLYLLSDPILKEKQVHIVFTPLIWLEWVYDSKLAPRIRKDGHTYVRDNNLRIIHLDN